MKKIVFIISLMLISVIINVYCFSTKNTGPKGVNDRKELMQSATKDDTKYIEQASTQVIDKLKSGNYQSIVDFLTPSLTRYQAKKLEKKLKRNCHKDICVSCVRARKGKKPHAWEAECKVSGGDVIYFSFCICKGKLRLHNVY